MDVPAKVWKVLGVAGIAGVAATGVVVVRDHRRRQQLSPEQVRKQLHERLADLDRPGGRPDQRPDRSAVAPAAGPKAPVKKPRR